MSISPLTFTGVSSYSTDFQTILKRAVSIASLPVQSLQNQQTDTLSKKQLTSSLRDSVAAFADSLQSLATVGDNHGIVANSSNSSKVSIVSTAANTVATYTITDITSIASAASETSASGYANGDTAPVSSTGTLNLVAGGVSHRFTLGSGKNNLAGIRDAINALDAGVTATVLTTGTGNTPDYLSISSNTAGQNTLQLRDDPDHANVNLLTANNQGSNTVFNLNGVPVSKPTTLINDVVPGVSFNVLAPTATNESITLSLGSDRTALSTALQDFAGKYNALSKLLDGQIGQTAGILSGDFIVRDIQTSLRQLTNFTGSGAIKSFADVGLELDSSGQLSLNQKTFNALNDAQVGNAFSFVSSSAQGIGSLAANFTQISDPISGLIKIQQDQYDQTDKRLTDQISTLNNQISEMQTSLSQKLQQADALLAGLQSQQNTLTASLQSLQFVLFGNQSQGKTA